MRPGETAGRRFIRLALQGFNPPPAVRPGESGSGGPCSTLEAVFQSAPGGEAGGKASMIAAGGSVTVFQSAPGGEAGGK